MPNDANDMPKEAQAIYDKALKAFLADDADEDAAIKFAKQAVKTAGWTYRNGKWAQAKDHALETRTVGPVEVFAAGHWNGDTYNIDDLDAMVSAFHTLKGFVDAPVQVGHTSAEWNMNLAAQMGVPADLILGDEGRGAMALGWISKLWREGEILKAELSDVPVALAELIQSRSYRTVSVTVLFDLDFNDQKFRRVISSVSLLGLEQQAVTSITGLETSAVFVELAPAHVYTMFADEPVTAADLNDTFAAVSEAVEAAIKGRKGAPTFRAFLGELKKRLKDLVPAKQHAAGDVGGGFLAIAGDVERFMGDLDAGRVQIPKRYGDGQAKTLREVMESWDEWAGSHTKGQAFLQSAGVGNPAGISAWLYKQVKGIWPGEFSLGGDKEHTTKEDDAMKEQVIKMLGLAEDATDEQVMETLTALKAGADESAAKSGKYASLEAKVATLTQEHAATQTALAGETRLRKISEFAAVTANFTAIAGTPHEMATLLVDLEEWKPEAAWEMACRYEAMDTAAKAAGIMANAGTPAEGTPEVHEFTKQVDELVKGGKTRPEAMTELTASNPALYREYRKSQAS